MRAMQWPLAVSETATVAATVGSLGAPRGWHVLGGSSAAGLVRHIRRPGIDDVDVLEIPNVCASQPSLVDEQMSGN